MAAVVASNESSGMASLRSGNEAEVAVVGGGPVGLTAAIALAAAGVPTALIAPAPKQADNRTTALLGGSVNALEAIGAWTRCRAQAAPLRAMRIVDDTDRLWRAPEVRFDAAEIGLEAFGWNVENRHLLAALDGRAADMPELLRIEDQARAVEVGDADVTIRLVEGGALTVRLLVAADGSRSLCRAAAGIETRSHSYRQTAVTFNLGHARPHHDISTEFHTAHGPFTLVPLPGLRSSLVWVVAPDEADLIAQTETRALEEEIERRSHSILGKITREPGGGVFPLRVETAHRFAARRIALVGEAGHVMPPIGAQGLNLGLRDAATIAELVAAARRRGGDVGGSELIDAYDQRRRADVTSRTVAVDLLNRTLLSDFLPTQSLRGLGLYMLDRIGPLRRAMMREGMASGAGQPRLMRGEAL
jgi:2-octaprenyl-6-methoxyphenol hydroxylase